MIDKTLRDNIIVALDCPKDQALGLAEKLKGHARWLKVGMTLYYLEGPSIVQCLKEMGFQIFLDLKLHDIPHQVQGAVASAARSGADMLSIHALGGREMLKAARAGALAAATELRTEPLRLLAITVLTSMDEENLTQIGVNSSVQAEVEKLALLARDAEIDGLVSSAHEASFLRKHLGSDTILVTPGVRPASSLAKDQKRVATPREAFSQGANYLVIGRPITEAADPAAAFEDIVASLAD